MVTVCALPWAAGIEVSADISNSIIPPGSKFEIEKEVFDRNFDLDNFQLIVWENLPCDSRGYELVKSLETALRGLRDIKLLRGISTPNSSVLRSSGSDIEIVPFGDLIGGDVSSWCDELARADELSELRSRRSSSVATVMQFRSGGEERAVLEVTAKIKNLQGDLDSLGARARFVGEAVISNEVLRVTQRDSSLALTMPFIAGLIVLWISRSVKVVLFSLAGSIVSLTLTLAAMALCEIPLSPITSFLLFLIFPLSASFIIHVHGYVNVSSESGILRSAFLFAGSTTVVAFLATAISPIPDLRWLGVFGALAIGILTLFVLTLMGSRWFESKLRTDRGAARSVRFLQSRWVAVVAAVLSGTVLLSGLPNVKSEYGPTDYLPLSNSTRADLHYLDEGFGRMSMPIVVRNEEGVLRQEYLNRVGELIRHIEDSHTGVRVDWLLPRLNKAIALLGYGDDLDLSPDMYSQIYEFFVKSDTADISVPGDALVLQCQMPFVKSSDYLRFKSHVIEEAKRRNVEIVSFGGRVDAYFEIGSAIARQMLVGMAVVGVFVFALFVLYVRSFMVAAASLVVNLLAVALGLAMLGLLEIDLELGSAIVLAILFGVIVDDTAHYMARYKHVLLGRSDHERLAPEWIAIRESAPVLAASTVAVLASFVVFFFVELKLLGDFALLSIVVLSAALVCNLVFLPRVLLFGRQFASSR